MIDSILDEEEDATQYAIDESWFEENGYTFRDFVLSRFPPSSADAMDQEIEERHTVTDKKSGRVSFEIKRVKLGDNPVRMVKEVTSKQRDYITPDMPTLEAVFRVLLANGNQPMTLGAVRESLAEWCPGGGCQWLLLPLEAIERLVARDQFYGIRPHQPGA
ncbi:MAG: hypothetical protein U0821_09670 [Chloroflexota bacterium]